MQERMRKHHTENKMRIELDSMEKSEEKPVHWTEIFKEAFNDLSKGAVALKGFRNREGLTQQNLSEILDIPQSNISKMENGKRAIGKSMAKKFAEFFKTDYRVFL